MYRVLYSCLFYLAIPLILLRLLKRSIKEPGYRQAMLERFGYFKTQQQGDLIWIHSVAAGETIAAAPLIQHLVDAGFPCLVTNMTPTGRERTRVLLGDSVENCYAPYDTPGSVKRFLDNNRPRLLITIDTELWPNTLLSCASRGISTALVNGRMAVRSAEGYAKFPLTQAMLQAMSLIAVQTQPHANRFEALGADPDKIKVTGSIKFDGTYATGHQARLAVADQITGGRSVVLGASTHDGEEQALLESLASLQVILPDILLVLAPRHTHRADQVVKQCQAAGYEPRLFSQSNTLEPEDRVLILDVMGELESYFPLARVAFIGGSLIPVGGHNLLEAVRAGTAVVMGPHLDNVEDITQQFVDRDAMRVVQNKAELRDELIGLMRDEGSTRRLVDAATKVLEDNRGSIDRNVQLIRELLR